MEINGKIHFYYGERRLLKICETCLKTLNEHAPR